MAAARICLRDRPGSPDAPARPGILAAILERAVPGLEGPPRGRHDTPIGRLLGQAMEQAGIRASQRARRVGDYTLERVIGEGPGYQDWQAKHVTLDHIRRVRLYHVRGESSRDDRERIRRAAEREFQILETLQHPGVLRVFGFTEHELGPALIFERDPLEIRLDHYLAQNRERLTLDTRLDLMRQIAEVVRFAHEKKVVHRGLAPQSILVRLDKDPQAHPRIKVFNWQLGFRAGSDTTGVTRSIAPTSHVDRLVDDSSQVYLAPEAIHDDGQLGEHLDVFSLGALAYHLFSGEPPAATAVELDEKLRDTVGLQISAVMNGAGVQLQDLVKDATRPDVASRTGTVDDFLAGLDKVEDELTSPDHKYVTEPLQAQRGDLLPGHFTVVRRLGQGACSVGLLVQRDGQEFVLKVASGTEQNERVREEAAVLAKLRHPYIVELIDPVEIGVYSGFLMRPVFVNTGKDELRIETLGQRLRKEGRLHLELLQRFGSDLLGVLQYLEEQGIPHRDIKPDNIAVGAVGRGDVLHAILFDFSLARAPADRINAGTLGYLDPMLPLRKPRLWDLHAERYAMAATLHELTTGTLPVWGDGITPAQHLSCEATIDPELFDTSLRDAFTEFFTRAFRRDVRQRFDNAEEMHAAWKHCFAQIDVPSSFDDAEDEQTLRAHLAAITLESHIHELGLGTRATNALDRANILSVDELLGTPMRRLLRLRGVGNKTRREIAIAVRLLRERFGADSPSPAVDDVPAAPAKGEKLDPASLSLDLLVQRLELRPTKTNETAVKAARALLGLDEKVTEVWPSQVVIAQRLGVTRARISQLAVQCQERWAKDTPLSRLRDRETASTLLARTLRVVSAI